jgi:hypothetical protein
VGICSPYLLSGNILDFGLKPISFTHPLNYQIAVFLTAEAQRAQRKNMNLYDLFTRTDRQRVSDGSIVPILGGCESANRILILLLPQLGDFDSLEYAWWLKKEPAQIKSTEIAIRIVGIGDRSAGEKFCNFTGFPAESLFVDPTAQLHTQLNLYPGLTLRLPKTI